MFLECTRDVLKMFSQFIIDTLVCMGPRGYGGSCGSCGSCGSSGPSGFGACCGSCWTPWVFLGLLDLAGLHKLFHTAIPDGRTRSKLGEHGKHGEHGEHRNTENINQMT